MPYDTPARVAALRSCAAHGGNFWLGHDSKSFGGRFFCPQYLRDLFANFDPQPRPKEIRYGQPEGDHTVRLIDGGDTQYVVLDRRGDLLTLRPLGMPEAPTTEVQVAACWPARYVNPSTRTCQK
mgnify:CR=1 FL=1